MQGTSPAGQVGFGLLMLVAAWANFRYAPALNARLFGESLRDHWVTRFNRISVAVFLVLFGVITLCVGIAGLVT